MQFVNIIIMDALWKCSIISNKLWVSDWLMLRTHWVLWKCSIRLGLEVLRFTKIMFQILKSRTKLIQNFVCFVYFNEEHIKRIWYMLEQNLTYKSDPEKPQTKWAKIDMITWSIHQRSFTILVQRTTLQVTSLGNEFWI